MEPKKFTRYRWLLRISTEFFFVTEDVNESPLSYEGIQRISGEGFTLRDLWNDFIHMHDQIQQRSKSYQKLAETLFPNLHRNL